VIDVSIIAEGVIVTVRLRRRRRVCSRCGQSGRLAIHDRLVKRRRHLDLEPTAASSGASCGGRGAAPAARAVRGGPVGGRGTRDFEDLACGWPSRWPSPDRRLQRIAWDSVGPIVADHLNVDCLAGDPIRPAQGRKNR
jgi:hypothetical protein